MPGIQDLLAEIGLLIVLMTVSPISALDRSEPVDVLYLSRFAARGYSQNRVMTPDPSIRVNSIPMPGHHLLRYGEDIDVLARIMRIYFPRNYRTLVEGSDLVVMFEAPCGLEGLSAAQFDPRWMSWLVKGIREDGLDLIMMGGDGCWGGGPEGTTVYRSWGETMLDDVLPFESLGGTNPPQAAFHKPEFLDLDHPLAGLPWSDSSPVEVLNKVEPKLGATMIAQAAGRKDTYPWIACWEQGSGKVVGETQIFWSKETTNTMFAEWEWYDDFVICLMYFGVDKEIPDDLELVHMLRGYFTDYMLKVSLLVSHLEFVENFGANSAPLYDDLDRIRQVQRGAEDSFVAGEYQSTLDRFREIDERWEELEERADRVKDNALMWVYAIEWLAVSGVSLVSGTMLWILMVGRRLYREGGTTRLG